MGAFDDLIPANEAPAETNTTPMRFKARATGYYPTAPDASAPERRMEGGSVGAGQWHGKSVKQEALYSLEDYQAGNAPYVSVAMDNTENNPLPYGTMIHSPEFPGVPFRVMDTGDAFNGAQTGGNVQRWGPPKGLSRIDIRRANAQAASRDNREIEFFVGAPTDAKLGAFDDLVPPPRAHFGVSKGAQPLTPERIAELDAQQRSAPAPAKRDPIAGSEVLKKYSVTYPDGGTEPKLNVEEVEFRPDHPPAVNVLGQLILDPNRYVEGIEHAQKQGWLGPEEANWMRAEAPQVEALRAERARIKAAAGENPELKALLAGGARGSAMMTGGYIAGESAGATAGALTAGNPYAVAGAGLLAGGVGAIVTGLAHDKAMAELAKSNELAATLQASAQLEPKFAQTGELAAFLVPAPAALGRLGRGTGLVAETKGAGAAGRFVAGQLAKGAAVGAGADVVIRGAAQALGIDGLEITPESTGLSAALGAVLGAGNVRIREYQTPEVAEILRRGLIWEQAKTSTPDGGVIAPKVQPLSKAEQEVFEQAISQLGALRGSGRPGERVMPEGVQIEAQQVVGSPGATKVETRVPVQRGGLGARAGSFDDLIPPANAPEPEVVVSPAPSAAQAEFEARLARAEQMRAMVGRDPETPVVAPADVAPAVSVAPAAARPLVATPQESATGVRLTEEPAVVAAPAESGAIVQEYAGENARGFDQAKAEGRTFTGRYDGKERFEIDDSRAEIIEDALPPGVPELGRLVRHKEMASRFGNWDEYTKAQNQIDAKWDQAGWETINSRTLGQILDHPELFQAYPDLANIPVRLTDDVFSDGGYDSDTDSIYVGHTMLLNPDRLRNLLLHEVQHAIQTREGFAYGANLDMFTGSEAERLDQYNRTAGEIEARDVEARAELTPEERAELPPYSSENIPADRAVVVYLGAKGVTSPARVMEFLEERRRLAKAVDANQLELIPYEQPAGATKGTKGGGAIAQLSAAASGGTVRAGGGGSADAGGSAGRGDAVVRGERAALLRDIAEGNPVNPERIRKAFVEGQTISSIDETLVAEPQLGMSLRGAVVRTPADVARLFQGILRNPYKEVLRVLKINGGVVEASEILHVGALSESVASVQEVLRFLARSPGAGKEVIISHNHPSGDPTPSGADARVTDLFRTALKNAGYTLGDHVVTNGGRYYSFTEGGEGTFPAEPAPWELVPRDQLVKLNDSEVTERVLATLRTGDPDAVHVALLTTKLGLTAIHRLPADQPLAQLAGQIQAAAATQGAWGFAIGFPKMPDAATAHLRQLEVMRLLELLRATLKLTGGPTLLDANLPEIPSAVGAGLMEAHAKLAAKAAAVRETLMEEPGSYSPLQAVDDRGTPYAVVPMAGMNTVRIVEMPELVQLARDLMGQMPDIAKLRSARGQFHPVGNGRIRLDRRIFSDPESAAKTLAHEIGHLIDYLPDQTMQRGNLHGRLRSLRKFMQEQFGGTGVKNKELRAELVALSQYWKPYDPLTAPQSYVRYRESAVELYADAISVLLNSPVTLKQMAPQFYTEFFRHLDTKPEVKSAFFGLQAWLQRPYLAVLKDRAVRAQEMFAKGEEIFERKWKEREERYKGFRGWLSRLKQGFFDNYAPIRDREAQAGKTHVWDSARFVFDEHPLSDNRVVRWLERMHRTVVEPLEAAGFSMDDLSQYLLWDRIANESYAVSGRIAEQMGISTGGRSHIANPQGHNPRTARAQLLAMRVQNGIRRQTDLERLVGKFHDEVLDVMREAYRVGLLTPDQWKLIQENRDRYATFTPLEYVDVFLPAALVPQAGTFKEIASPFVSTISKMLTMQRAIQYQRIKVKTVQVLQRDFPGEVQRAETRRDANGRENPVPPREKGMEQIMIREQGKPAWFNVPKEVALMLERVDLDLIQSGLSILDVPFRKFFYPLFITYNPVFQLVRNPLRDFRRSLVNVPHGVGFWSLARQLPVVKHVGSNPLFEEVRTFVQTGQQSPLIAEMLDNLAITPADATFNATAGRPVTAFDRLREQFGLLPPSEQPAWRATRFGKLVAGLGDMISDVGRRNEILPKATVYRVLTKELGWHPREAAYYVRNYIGTPNFSRRGKHIGLINSVIPFINIWTKGWAADLELTTRGYQRTDRPDAPGKSAASWWIRWAMTSGIWTVLKVGGTLGLLGAGIKKLYDGVSDHYKANYDILPIGVVPGGDYGEKVAFVPIPKDPSDRILSGILYNTLRVAGVAAAKEGVFGAEVQRMNENEQVEVGTMLTKNISAGASDVPGLNPLLKLAGGWTDYLQGQNPYDAYRGNFVMSEAEFLAGGWNSLKPMIGWTWGQSGMQSFVSFNPDAGMTLEQAVRAPLINGMVKITDQGYKERLMAGERLEDQAAARVKLGMPANAQKLNAEYWFLQKLGRDDRNALQEQRYQELRTWNKAFYQPTEEVLRLAEESGMSEAERKAMTQRLEELSSNFERK